MNTDRLKFRVWDNTQKRYLDSDFRIRSDGTIFYDGISLAGEELSDLVFEQCTGLKDANGKLIYEGDILLSTDGSTYSVEYDVHYARFLRRGKFHNGHTFFSDIDSTKAENFLRVIGTIHENPELLGEKK